MDNFYKNSSYLIFLIVGIVLMSFCGKYFSQSNTGTGTGDILSYKDNTKNIGDGPCYLYENTNRTQIVYLEILNILKNMSNKNDRKRLENCKRNVYIQGTTDNRLKTELNEISEIILKKINTSGSKYDFKIVSLDTITEFVDPDGNKNFKYLLFIYDKIEEIQLRLYIDVIKYIIKCDVKNNSPPTCASITTPEVNTFEIGFPQPEQLLPLPTQTVNTGFPDLLSAEGINIKKIAPIKSIYINEIKIYNTDAVINANGQCIMDGVCGNIKNTTLSSSAFNQPTTPFQEPACVRNRWMKLPDQPTGVKAWPCGSVSPYWNTKGIPLSVSPDTQYTGIRSSTTQIPITGEYYPTLATIPRNSGPNSWLFSLTRGDTATEGADFTD